MPTSSRKHQGQKSVWPTIEEQLLSAKVKKGSALEKFIRKNQDISLLRPGEAEGDTIGIPLWLRVHYRKTHADLALSPAGPVGDYPDYLENVYEWAVINQDLPKMAVTLKTRKSSKPKGGNHGK